MAKQDSRTLDPLVRAAQRDYAASQYPGDLAADLGLTGTAARRGWLQRWRPALTLCAIIALVAGGIGVWARLGPTPSAHRPAVAGLAPEPAARDNPPHSVPRHHTPPAITDRLTRSVAAVTRVEFTAFKQQVADQRASAKRVARDRLARMLAQHEPVKTSVTLRPMTASAIGFAATPRVALTLPRGLTLSASAPPPFAKERS